MGAILARAAAPRRAAMVVWPVFTGRPRVGATARPAAPALLYKRCVMALIHTCYRIGDIDRSVAFYEALGFEEIGRLPIRDEAVNVFMGLPGDGARLELTYNF